MTLPTVRAFQINTEARFPEEEAVPKDLKKWWAETRENLERLKDKISQLEAENQDLKERVLKLERL